MKLIKFELQMNAFVALAKEKGMAALASTVCATGGGAYKFEPEFRREVLMNLNKFDELDSLIRGVEFMVEHRQNHELFYYQNPQVNYFFKVFSTLLSKGQTHIFESKSAAMLLKFI